MKHTTNLVNEFNLIAVSNSAIKFIRNRGIQFTRILMIAILLMNFTAVFSSCNKNEKEVLDAYKLRTQGKVDEAKAMLLSILEEDSTIAMAHFELARTLNYMNMMGSDEATNALKQAKKLEPDNVIYAYGYARNCFLEAYKAMQMGGGDVNKWITKTCDEFKNVLDLESGYPEALMYLVEIYGMLPENMGGDKAKAEEYTRQLESTDKFFGAKARLVMMPEGTDMVEYWNKYIAENGEDCKSLKELGVASLFADDIDGAKKSFEKAMAINKSQNIRILDLARFHMMKVMQNQDAAGEELPKAKEYVEQYLNSKPEPIPPLHAYALGMMVKIKMFSGNQEEGEKLMEEAKSLDPYFSRAFGIPSLATFEPPNKPNHHFTSFFSPY
ncbi:MAG: hypothetical protein ABFS16_16215 [Bacteroidota bacterium]